LGGDRFRYGCVLELQMAEGRGSKCYDQSGYGNDGTIYGARWQKGPIVYALGFDGVDDYVEVPDSAVLNPAKEITVAAWVQRQPQVEEGIVLKNPIATRNYRLFLYAGGYGYPTFEIIDTTGKAHRAEYFTVFPLDEWHCLAGTFDGRYVKIYLDGELKSTRDIGFTVSIRQNPGDLWIGRVDGERFYGVIGVVRIYDRALSSEEVFALYSYLVSPAIRAPELGVG